MEDSLSTKRVLAVLIAVVSSLYLLPFSVAVWNNHPRATQILLWNILVGWTIIGWIIVLVWALR